MTATIEKLIEVQEKKVTGELKAARFRDKISKIVAIPTGDPYQIDNPFVDYLIQWTFFISDVCLKN